MSCLSFEIKGLNSATFSADAKNDLTFVAAVKNDLTLNVGLVCQVSIGGVPAGYEVLWASDGILFTIDNGYLYVRK